MQDISCVGQCSMTVALPILSACGVETCILPTAVLSTHTGGFGKPAVIHFDNMLDSIWQHWREQNITFDAILVGYLGSLEAVRVAGDIMDQLLAPGGITVVDPALADHGKMYSGLLDAYAQAMADLCRRADIILPNVTEAAMFSGTEYHHKLSGDYISQLLNKLNHPCVVLTGVGYQELETGIVIYKDGIQQHYAHKKVGKSYHGTGDMYAACFTGALLQGRTELEAAQIAAAFVCKSIENTLINPAHWYGIKFETVLPWLASQFN